MKKQSLNTVDLFLHESADVMKTLVQRLAAPEHVDRLYESRRSAESYLTNDDPKLRLSAIVVIAHQWALDDALIAACERLLRNDPDPEVRAYAMGYLAYGYYETDDARIGKMAAEIVYENAQPHVLRRAAYAALFNLRQSARNSVPKRNQAIAPGFRFPEDVDWRFVDTFLYGGKRNGIHPKDLNGLLF